MYNWSTNLSNNAYTKQDYTTTKTKLGPSLNCNGTESCLYIDF